MTWSSYQHSCLLRQTKTRHSGPFGSCMMTRSHFLLFLYSWTIWFLFNKSAVFDCASHSQLALNSPIALTGGGPTPSTQESPPFTLALHRPCNLTSSVTELERYKVAHSRPRQCSREHFPPFDSKSHPSPYPQGSYNTLYPILTYT